MTSYPERFTARTRPARAGRPYELEIAACGYAYPSLVVDNEEFFARAGVRMPFDRDLLLAETRMRFRRWCDRDESTWTLARRAVRSAVEAVPGIANEIDVVLTTSGTTLPVIQPIDDVNPGMADLAPLILTEIGRDDALGLDLKACYCTGFIRCLETADALLANPNYRAALVVSAEQTSRLSTAPTNRSSFAFVAADAAGAALLRKREPGWSGTSRLLDYVNLGDAGKRDWCGIGRDGRSMVMKGARTAEAMLTLLVEAGRLLLERNHLRPDDLTWLLPSQTHARLVDECWLALGWKRERVLWFGDAGGFSGSASIPCCLAEQRERGVIRPGDVILAVAVGAGLTSGAALLSV